MYFLKIQNKNAGHLKAYIHVLQKTHYQIRVSYETVQ